MEIKHQVKKVCDAIDREVQHVNRALSDPNLVSAVAAIAFAVLMAICCVEGWLQP